MAKRPKLTVVGFMQLKDGRTIPLKDLTEEEMKRCRKSMAERCSRSLSDYYRQHPDEYEQLESKY